MLCLFLKRTFDRLCLHIYLKWGTKKESLLLINIYFQFFCVFSLGKSATAQVNVECVSRTLWVGGTFQAHCLQHSSDSVSIPKSITYFVYFFDFLDTYHRTMELFSDISVAVLYILFTVSRIYPHFVFNCPRKNPMVRGADTAESWTQLSPHTLPSNWSLLELIFVFKPTLVVCYKPLHSLI